ncbi:MFS transporter [Pseudofrankia sp. BMG5.36]|uniref:MFS transporter n=1 Tax=Pseudofrankia sp. BMG5.36 TaxID=1834512 RepID=UPI0009F473EF|nr:MFS transporter [Pseudofrankia sp. BMG5.36]
MSSQPLSSAAPPSSPATVLSPAPDGLTPSAAAPARSTRTAVLLACGGSFLAFLDATITNLAVPDLARDFEVGVTSVSWVVTLYALPFAALLAPAGRLADLFGRRRLFVAGAALFTAASLLAVVAPVFPVLLAARAVQGVGAALLIPASFAIVLADTPPDRRAAAIGLWSASAGLAAVAGPAVGGILVDVASWRVLFCINLPIGLWLIERAVRYQPRATPTEIGASTGAGADTARRRAPDALATVLLAGGIGAVVLSLTEAQRWGWASPATLGFLLGGALSTVAAVGRSARHPAPAIEVDLWRSPGYAVANVISALFGAALYASLLLGVLFLVEAWQYSVLTAGLAMTPAAGWAALVGISIGRSRRQPAPWVLVVVGGALIAATSLVLAIWLPADARFLTVWLPAGLGLGVGIGAVSVGVSSAAALAVEPRRFAAAVGLNIAARQVGGAIGVAATALLLDRQPGDGIGPFQDVYWMMAALCGAVAVVGLLLRPSRRPGPLTPEVGR